MVDARARLRLGRRVQVEIEKYFPLMHLKVVDLREAIMGHVEDAELAGAFAVVVESKEDGQ